MFIAAIVFSSAAPGLEGVLPGEDGHGKLDDVAADSPAVIRRKLKKTSESSEEENKFEGKRRASEIMTEETVETGTVRLLWFVSVSVMNKSVTGDTHQSETLAQEQGCVRISEGAL